MDYDPEDLVLGIAKREARMLGSSYLRMDAEGRLEKLDPGVVMLNRRPSITADEDDLVRYGVQSIRNQLNDAVIHAARQFKAPKVTHEERDGQWFIVIRETAV